MIDRDRLAVAIRTSWTKATSAAPSLWSAGNPSRGHCDVTSLVVLEYLGGDLQLAQVLLDDEPVEHHYWNQLADDDVVDLTRQQFQDGQRIGAPEIVSNELIRTKYPTAREELRERHELLRSDVWHQLGEGPDHPLGS